MGREENKGEEGERRKRGKDRKTFQMSLWKKGSKEAVKTNLVRGKKGKEEGKRGRERQILQISTLGQDTEILKELRWKEAGKLIWWGIKKRKKEKNWLRGREKEGKREENLANFNIMARHGDYSIKE